MEVVDSHNCPGGTWHIKRKRHICIKKNLEMNKYSKLTSNKSKFNKSFILIHENLFCKCHFYIFKKILFLLKKALHNICRKHKHKMKIKTSL